MVTISEILGNVNFQNFIYDLNQGGWFQYIFPFMLVYAVVLTILNKVELFEERKPVKVIIAFVMGLFSIAFPITGGGQYGSGQTLGDLMMALFPGVTAFSVGVLALYIVVAMLGVDLTEFFGKGDDKNNILKYVLGGLGLFVVIYYYARGFGWLGFGSGYWFDSFFSDPLLYILILFGLFFWWITKDEDDDHHKKKDEHGTHIHVGENQNKGH